MRATVLHAQLPSPVRRQTLVAALGFAVLLAPPGALWAGTTGKITGRVLDRQQRPVVAATVALVGQPYGAFTSAQGEYTILNVPPGTYEARINRVGYKPLVVQGVIVSADNTTKLDAALDEVGIRTETVTVTAERPPVDVNLTSSMATLRSEDIATLPVQELQDIVNLQAGVVDGHFRGGRTGEVQYQVDGVSVNNAYDNSSSLRIDRSLLQEVQVISGTFDAEYGQAMSGVVNAVLKQGTPQFEWNAELYGGGFFFPARETERLVEDALDPLAIRNFTVTASGPLGLPKTVFLANVRHYAYDEYVTAERLYQTVPIYVESTQTYVPRPGDGDEIPLGENREWSGALKITNTSLPKDNLSYQLLLNDIEGRRANYYYRVNPDGRSQQHTFALAHGLDWTRTLGKSSFLDLSFRQNYRTYTDWAYEDLYDARYDAAGPPVESPNEPGVYLWGVDFTRFEQTTNTWLLKGSWMSQVTPEQQVKAGLEMQWPEVRFGTPGHLVYTTQDGVLTLVRHADEPPDWPAVQTYWPILGAGFAQDQIEWRDLTLRAGARIDYFDARATLPSDLRNPANAIEGAPESVPVESSVKVSVSPRLGVAYPITERSGVHFAYGHFYQFPPMGDVFNNADYTALRNLQAGTANFGRVMGNPDVEPEQTVQYEFGYKQALTRDFGFELSAFYKDIRDLLGVEFITTYNDATYARLANADFGSVVGLTVALDHRRIGPASLALDYTWQLAQGNSSDPDETAVRAEAGEDPRPRVIPFNWDQRHTFNMTLALASPDRYSASAVLRAGSGQPYTPELDQAFGYGLEANSGRKPAGAILDLRGEYLFRSWKHRTTLFGRIYNVFDSRYFNGGVFASTGSPFYSRFPSADYVALNDPLRFYGPRRLEIGFTVGSGAR